MKTHYLIETNLHCDVKINFIYWHPKINYRREGQTILLVTEIKQLILTRIQQVDEFQFTISEGTSYLFQHCRKIQVFDYKKFSLHVPLSGRNFPEYWTCRGRRIFRPVHPTKYYEFLSVRFSDSTEHNKR